MAKIMKKTVAILVLVLAVVSVQADNPYPLPLQNFVPTAFPPADWERYTRYTIQWVRSGTGRPGSAGSAEIIAGGGIGAGANQPAQRSMLITPAIQIPDVDFYELSFWSSWQFNRSAANKHTAVLVSTTNNNSESFSQLHTLTGSGTTTGWSGWSETVVSLAQFRGQTIYLAFLYERGSGGGSSSNWRVDDVVVRPVETIRHLFTTPLTSAIHTPTNQNIIATFNREITEGNFDGITVVPAIPGDFTVSIDENNLVLSHGDLHLQRFIRLRFLRER